MEALILLIAECCRLHACLHRHHHHHHVVHTHNSKVEENIIILLQNFNNAVTIPLLHQQSKLRT